MKVLKLSLFFLMVVTAAALAQNDSEAIRKISDEAYADIQNICARIRFLKCPEKPEFKVITNAKFKLERQAAHEANKKISADVTASIKRNIEVNKYLGTMPMTYQDADYYAHDSSQFSAYYDHDHHQVFINENVLKMDPFVQKRMIVHELMHAVQRANFSESITTLYGQRDTVHAMEERQDNLYAILSIIEGEAEYFSTAPYFNHDINGYNTRVNNYFFESMKSAVTAMKDEHAYHITGYAAGFPYSAGHRFIRNLATRYSKIEGATLESIMGQLNKLYDRQDITTEQILDVEKFINNERPVSLPDSLVGLATFKGAKVLHKEFVGALYWQMILMAHLPINDNNIEGKVFYGAQGWDGSRNWLVEVNGQSFAVNLSAWEKETDVQEAQAVLNNSRRSDLAVTTYRSGTKMISIFSKAEHRATHQEIYNAIAPSVYK